MSRILGIDLGTTNSLACIWGEGEVIKIPNSFGDFLTPSVVSFDNDGTVLVGKAAKERLTTYPGRTFASFKRHMGTDKKFTVDGKTYAPEDLSAFVLKKLRTDAEAFLGEEIEEAVISVPAYFDDRARRATKNAGAIAGLKVDRIINEPSAASLGYLKCSKTQKEDSDTNENTLEESTILIVDFGGGTLDVSLVEAFDNVIEIISVSGDNKLGGIDFDKHLADYFIKTCGLNIEEKDYNSILSSAEICKKNLTVSSESKIVVNLPGFQKELPVSRKLMAQVCSDVLKRIAKPIQNVLMDSRVAIDEITDIILVGGSSKMIIVQQYLKHILDRDDIFVCNPDEAIAVGMGVYAGIKERNADVSDYILTDVCPFSLGTAIYNEGNPDKSLSSFIIPRNTALPVSRTGVYSVVHDFAKGITIRVFQGEEMYADDNRQLSEIKIELPPGVKKGELVNVTFSYDMNGILLVDVSIPHLNIEEHATVYDKSSGLDEAQIAASVKKLEELKTLNGEDEEDKMIREWGERLFRSCPPYIQEEIVNRMKYYDAVQVRDRYRSIKFRNHLKEYFLYLDMQLSRYTLDNWEYEEDWSDSEEDSEEENSFNEWLHGFDNNDDDGL